MLYPFIAKDEQEKSLVRRSVGPFWDGNEVWLLTAGGALFAAFAPAYATSFSGFYLAIMLVLFGLIFRAVALEFRENENSLPRFFDGAFFLGSALPALLFGAAIGNVLQGVPLDMNGNYMGLHLVGLLRPFPLVCGVLSLTVMLLQGASWQALKQPIGSALRERAKKLRGTLIYVVVVVFVLASALYFLLCAPELGLGLGQILSYVAAILVLVGVIAGIMKHGKADNGKKTSDVATFVSISIIPAALIILTAASLFPYLIPSTAAGQYGMIDAAQLGPSVTVASAGGSELALTAMTIISCIGVPLVLMYHVIIYRTFRGRLTTEDAVEG
jgi:cytochrome d ubiquinol oxidase subunit II